MLQFDPAASLWAGDAGTLAAPATDIITRKLAMLIEGECQLGPLRAAAKFGFSKQR